jgi:hypothetical protein
VVPAISFLSKSMRMNVGAPSDWPRLLLGDCECARNARVESRSG